MISSDVTFLTAGGRRAGAAIGIAPEAMAYDVDEYEAPIVTLSLTESEIEALEKNANVAAVEDDGLDVRARGGAAPRAPAAEPRAHGRGSALAARRDDPQSGSTRSRRRWPGTARGARGSRSRSSIPGSTARIPTSRRTTSGGASLVAASPDPRMETATGPTAPGRSRRRSTAPGSSASPRPHRSTRSRCLSASGSGNWSYLISGLDWCIKRRIKVASMSLGGSSAPSALEAMCDVAWNRGLLLIAAAGNTGATSSPGVGVPANYANVVAVSAIDGANTIASFSSRGPDVELCAPGVQVLSTLPGGGHGKMSGTSMACPHASGVAAVAWGGHRFSDNVTIRRVLARTADILGVPGRDDLYGYGRVDARQAACTMTAAAAVPGIPYRPQSACISPSYSTRSTAPSSARSATSPAATVPATTGMLSIARVIVMPVGSSRAGSAPRASVTMTGIRFDPLSTLAVTSGLTFGIGCFGA